MSWNYECKILPIQIWSKIYLSFDEIITVQYSSPCNFPEAPWTRFQLSTLPHLWNSLFFIYKHTSYKTSLSSDYKNCRSYSCIITTSLPVTSVVSWHLGLCHWCFQQILWSQEVFLPSHPKIYSIYLYLFCIRGSASGVYTCSFKNNTTLIIFTKKILHPYLFFFNLIMTCALYEKTHPNLRYS